jgi:hypothetical protein
MNTSVGDVDFEHVSGTVLRPSAPPWYGRAGPERFGARARLKIDHATIAVVILAAAGVTAWLSAVDFPLGTHPDEPAKVAAVLGVPAADFHPILMIQLARAANIFLGWTDPQSLVELGRTFAALAGGALIVATYLLARLILPASSSFAVAAATLATPLISVHARYFKEDIFVAPFVVLALVALIVTLRASTLKRIFALGTAIGLAGASKYVGGLLLIFYVPALMMVFGDRERIGMRAINAGLVVLIAAMTFTAVDLPAIFAGHRFGSNLHLEYVHAVSGHADIALPISLTLGAFHLRQSLWPGVGHLLTALGVLGLATPFFAAPDRRQPLAIIAGFAVLWYFAHELSPLKPYPDFARYMVPLAPLLVILGAAFVHEWTERRRPGAGAMLATLALLIAALPAWWMSLRVNVRADDDPRRLLPEIVANASGPVAVDGYASYAHVPFLAGRATKPFAPNTTIIVTSTFNYERYQRYGALPLQSAKTQAAAGFFARALALPHLDISNGRPAFGFFNPTITVVALDGKPERLLPIARLIAATDASLTVRWVEAGTIGGAPPEMTARASGACAASFRHSAPAGRR